MTCSRLGIGTIALAALSMGCPPASVLPSGCGKDTDCKGARVCIQHACADAPFHVARTEVPHAPADGGPISDGGAPADAAMSAQPVGPSSMFHVDAAHSGRSPFRAPAAAPHEVARVATGGVVYSSPAITDDGLVLFGSHDRSVYAANFDGTIRWRHLASDSSGARRRLARGRWSMSAPTTITSTRSMSKRGRALAVHRRPVSHPGGLGPGSRTCDVDGVTVAPDGTVYASADGLYALRPDGTLKWKFSPGVTHCASSPAVGPDGTVYVGCHDYALYAIDPETGVKRWEFRAGDDIDSSPAVAPDGTIYVGSDDRKLYAFEPGGALKFAVATLGAVRSSPALALDGTIYVGSFDGSLYAVRPNGQVAFSYRTADRVLSSPLVDAAGLIIFGSEDDRLYALAPDGKLAWSVLLDGDVDGTPALGPDGSLYVGADDHNLHVLR